jgi:hypothetical protein
LRKQICALKKGDIFEIIIKSQIDTLTFLLRELSRELASALEYPEKMLMD